MHTGTVQGIRKEMIGRFGCGSSSRLLRHLDGMGSFVVSGCALVEPD
jgi:hypothetical protein